MGRGLGRVPRYEPDRVSQKTACLVFAPPNQSKSESLPDTMNTITYNHKCRDLVARAVTELPASFAERHRRFSTLHTCHY
jgi:hypothetical protein